MAARQSGSSVLQSRRRAALIALVVLFAAARSFAQHHGPGEPSLCTVQYGASGTVTDALTGDPIAGARVTVNGDIETESAADGSFAVSSERVETCNVDYYVEVVVQADGYVSYRDALYTSVPVRHLDVRLAGQYTPTAVAPSPTPTPTGPGVDPCALPTAPRCPIGTAPECFSNDHCVGCTCRPCGPCPPGYHILEEVNVCVCTNDFHRVGGFVAESPPCEGRMRGVTVRLDPHAENLTAITDSEGAFEFPRVATGEHTLTVEPRCNELGCWDPVTVEAIDEDVSVALCPREGSDVRLSIDRVTGLAGSATEFDVRLDSGARPVASVSHTISFDAEAPITATSDAAPDCVLDPDLDADATFAFEPEGCTPGVDCERIRADVESDGALPDGSLYRCHASIPEFPSDLCSNALACGDLVLADPSGAPLQGTCADGAIQSALPSPELSFDFELTPEHPMVGEAVELRVTVHGPGGLPQYFLRGAAPVLSGDTSSRSGSSFRTVVYDLVAAENGTASLVMSVNFEAELGCPGHTYYGFTSDVSDPFLVVVGDGEGVTPTPTPTPTPTVPCPTATPIHCDFGGAFPQCSSEPSDGSACPHVTCRCVACEPCPEGQVFERLPNSCRCVDATTPSPPVDTPLPDDNAPPPGSDSEATGGGSGGSCAIARTSSEGGDWLLVAGALSMLAMRRWSARRIALPRYSLVDAMPFLRIVERPPPSSGPLGDPIVFDTVAECPGLARISFYVSYEARCGCSTSPSFCLTSAVSDSFPLAVRDVRLDPIGRTAETGLSDRHFSFGAVPPGDYTLSVSPSCNPFGCWTPQPIHVGDADVEVEFCPEGIVEDRCAGDCDENGRVEIDELITQVSIALGAADLACADADSNFDGAVAIDDLTRAIGNAIEGCP